MTAQIILPGSSIALTGTMAQTGVAPVLDTKVTLAAASLVNNASDDGAGGDSAVDAWVYEAIAAAGDSIYNWDIPSDSISWMAHTVPTHEENQLERSASGHTYNSRIHPEDLPIRLKALSDHFTNGALYDCEYRLRNTSGKIVWVHDRGTARFGKNGEPLAMTGVLRIITKRKQKEVQLERAANYDELTGHFNKTRLRQELDQALNMARRLSRPGAFMVIGIDKLAMINNAYGSDVGDAVLVLVSQRLDRTLRACDTIGRIGGDRFGVILEDCDEAHAVGAMERLINLIRETPFVVNTASVPISISIGCVLFPGLANTAYDVLTRAESALQTAKRSGRNGTHLFRPSEQQNLVHRSNLDMAVRVQRAIQERRLIFTYQPIVDAQTHEIIKYECLIRMREECGTIVPAGTFIPVVEQLGMSRYMDRYVLDLAVDELRAVPDLRLALNISGLTAMDQSWLRALTAAVKATPDIASRLIIEITETAALHDIEESARFVNAARDIGCQVAIDDFGAGFTSFRHLKALTVDLVKIDGSFVRNLSQNPDNQLFIRNLMGLAGTFGLKAVAEFVENAEDAHLLREVGVHYLQGYYFGQPSQERPWRAGERINPGRVQ